MAEILIYALGRPYLLLGPEKIFKKIKVIIKNGKIFLLTGNKFPVTA